MGGVGMMAMAILIPVLALTLALAFALAIIATKRGHTVTAVLCLASLLMIFSPMAIGSFFDRPDPRFLEPEDENPFWLVQYGVFPSAVLGVVTLALGLALNRRFKGLAVVLLLFIPLAFLALGHFGWFESNSSSFGDSVFFIGILIVSAYPGIWVLAIHQLSERFFALRPAS
jgi:hypothetical protein